MVELTPELIKALSKTRNGFYSWDYVAGLAVWILGVEANNERLQQRIAELEQDLSDQSQKRLENALASTDRIIALEGKIRELEQERRWIPVSERLPEDSRIYDVAIAGYGYSWTGICVFGKWIGESGKAILGVTHWKYRPQTPKEETK